MHTCVTGWLAIATVCRRIKALGTEGGLWWIGLMAGREWRQHGHIWLTNYANPPQQRPGKFAEKTLTAICRGTFQSAFL